MNTNDEIIDSKIDDLYMVFIINDQKCIVGFKEDEIKEALGL